ncbi:hypothetical protein NPIL_672211 [Nephila pilipes]|uniref:Uncharacterized protein n=1 Tax=Nephila pilipes TaxID=299642 RepID=A0A8X6NUU8_NEPPI|nr:hypothetical protein NPIL_672211 [Nephila pilipes]
MFIGRAMSYLCQSHSLLQEIRRATMTKGTPVKSEGQLDRWRCLAVFLALNMLYEDFHILSSNGKKKKKRRCNLVA